MPYDPTTPVATETPAQSRPNIQGNFLQISTSYDYDHVPLNSGSNVGSSNKLTFFDQSLNLPLPVAVANSDVFYSKSVINSLGTLIELFMQRPAGSAIQLTSGIAKMGTNVNFWQSFLPGGLQIRLGIASGNFLYVNGGLDDFPTNTIVALLTGQSVATQNVTLVGPSGFDVSGAGNYYFLAIGY